MDQILQSIQISKYNTTDDSSKKILIDKLYTIDDPIFENYGRINIPSGNTDEFFELRDVNFVFLMSDCPFNLLISDLVVISTKHFSFINPNSTITLSIQANDQYNLQIEYCYGLLKSGDQDQAIQLTKSVNSNLKWNRVLKNIILETDENISDLAADKRKEQSADSEDVDISSLNDKNFQHCADKKEKIQYYRPPVVPNPYDPMSSIYSPNLNNIPPIPVKIINNNINTNTNIKKNRKPQSIII